MPVSYCEIWNNDNNNMKFRNKILSEQALSFAINSFIHKQEKGLHVCIICTDNSDDEQNRLKSYIIDLINNETYCNYLSENATEYWNNMCSYACVEIESSITELLKKMVTIFGENLNKDIQLVSQWIEFCSHNEQDSFEKPEIWHNDMNLRSLNNFISAEERNGECADIKFIFFLPKQCYDTFTAPRCLFSEFIECIILALSQQGVIQLKLEEWNKKKEEFDKVYENFNKNTNNEKDLCNIEIKQKTDEMKQLGDEISLILTISDNCITRKNIIEQNEPIPYFDGR